MATITDIGIATDINSIISILLSNMPKAPSSLQAGYESCNIRLVWMDNADNETHFNVWMQALGGPPRVIATLSGTPKTGPVWYEFASPWTGIYSFWVESVNALGSQSSEIAWVGVTDLNCGANVATHLNIEILDMYVPGGYDQVACYLSLENTPEKRTPAADSTYIPTSNGFVDVSNWTGSGNRLLLPIPADNEVTLSGKCLGTSGGSPPKTLGTFNASAPQELWDGRRLELKPDNFTAYTIGYRIQYHGPSQVSYGDFKYTDYTLPAPTDLTLLLETSSDPGANASLAKSPYLRWSWSGDPKILTGFTLFFDGKPVVTSYQPQRPDGKWQDQFFLSTSCGGTYKIQIAANSGEAQSPLSASFVYKQPPCELYAEVKLETFEFTYVDDGSPPCDTAQVYFAVFVNGNSRSFGGSNLYYELSCGVHYFSHFTPTSSYQGSVDTFYIPLDPANSKIDVRLFFDDSDVWLDDYLCHTNIVIPVPYQDGENYSKSHTFPCPGTNWTSSSGWDAKGTITISVKGLNIPPSGP
jgi:hypothetical protein